MDYPNDKLYGHLKILSDLMDDKFEIFGWHFGLNFFIGLIPEAGDVITTLIALYVLFAALKFKIPTTTIIRMLINILIYFLVGLIPWLGDIFGSWWKPNKRNLKLLQKTLDRQLLA